MVHRKSVRFSGRDSVSDSSSPASSCNTPTHTKSILIGKSRDSAESFVSDEVFAPQERSTETLTAEEHVAPNESAEISTSQHALVPDTDELKEVESIDLSPAQDSQSTNQKSSDDRESSAKLEYYRSYVEDKARGQIYSVGAFRGTADPSTLSSSSHLQTKRYVLNPNHAAHRERKNKEKFDLITARFKVESDKAQKSLTAKTNLSAVANSSHVQDYLLNRHSDKVLKSQQAWEAERTPSQAVIQEQLQPEFNANEYINRVIDHQNAIETESNMNRTSQMSCSRVCRGTRVSSAPRITYSSSRVCDANGPRITYSRVSKSSNGPRIAYSSGGQQISGGSYSSSTRQTGGALQSTGSKYSRSIRQTSGGGYSSGALRTSGNAYSSGALQTSGTIHTSGALQTADNVYSSGADQTGDVYTADVIESSGSTYPSSGALQTVGNTYSCGGIQTSGTTYPSGVVQTSSTTYPSGVIQTSGNTYQSSVPRIVGNTYSGSAHHTSDCVLSESIYASPRLAEKQQLIELNSRLQQYIRHIRERKEDEGYLNSQAFLESVTVLEEELVKLKAMYEQELDQARIQIDDISRAKSHYEQEEKKAKSLASELKNRLEIEAQRNNQSSVEINSLQRTIAQKDLMIEEGRIALQAPAFELEKLSIEYQQLLRQHEDIKKRFEKEQLARQDAEDRLDTQIKKLDFQITINEQEKTEMQDRLTVANNTILSLEEKIREMSHHDKTLVDMLKRVRESAEDELRKYQDESEERHNRHLTELKVQIEEDDKRITELTEETTRLNDQITHLLTTIRELEGQNASLDHQKNSYMQLLDDEKRRATDHIKKMEFKLREVQEVLINKMRELNAARDAQIPLKAEIESFRALIEEEERRLRLGPGEFPELPIMPSNYRPGGGLTAPGFGTTPGIGTTPGLGSPAFVPISQQQLGSKPVLPNAHGYMDPSPQARPLGPVRIRSAPPPRSSLRQRNLNLVPTNVGQGTVYFDEMVKDLKLSDTVKETPTSLAPVDVKPSSPQILQDSPRQTSPTTQTPPNSPTPQLPDTGSSSVTMATPSQPLGMGESQGMSVSQGMTAVNGISTQAFGNVSSMSMTQGGSGTKYYQAESSSCAIGDLKIAEIHPDGRYIRVMNTGEIKDEEIGGYLVQQNVGGFPVAVFRFPPRTRLLANEVVTIWSGSNDNTKHQPPSDFVFKEQQKWGTGPECTTIICKPNGQAVAWQTGTHRFTKDAFTEGSAHNTSMAYQEEEQMTNSNTNNNNENNSNGENENTNENNNNKENNDMATADEQLTQYNMHVNEVAGEPEYIRREKEEPPSLAPPKHPHGTAPLSDVHPTSGQYRAKTYGNDNSSVNRQSRVQGQRPDPIPGAPYAGASAQRMGSASLRKFKPTLKGSGAIANKA